MYNIAKLQSCFAPIGFVIYTKQWNSQVQGEVLHCSRTNDVGDYK